MVKRPQARSPVISISSRFSSSSPSISPSDSMSNTGSPAQMGRLTLTSAVLPITPLSTPTKPMPNTQHPSKAVLPPVGKRDGAGGAAKRKRLAGSSFDADESSAGDEIEIKPSSPPMPQSTPTKKGPGVKAKRAKVEVKTESGGAVGGTSNKARIAAKVKQMIAEEIVGAGAAVVDVAVLAMRTGLTATQVRSQISDNRNNVRRQLVQFARGIQ